MTIMQLGGLLLKSGLASFSLNAPLAGAGKWALWPWSKPSPWCCRAVKTHGSVLSAAPAAAPVYLLMDTDIRTVSVQPGHDMLLCNPLPERALPQVGSGRNPVSYSSVPCGLLHWCLGQSRWWLTWLLCSRDILKTSCVNLRALFLGHGCSSPSCCQLPAWETSRKLLSLKTQYWGNLAQFGDGAVGGWIGTNAWRSPWLHQPLFFRKLKKWAKCFFSPFFFFLFFWPCGLSPFIRAPNSISTSIFKQLVWNFSVRTVCPGHALSGGHHLSFREGINGNFTS